MTQVGVLCDDQVCTTTGLGCQCAANKTQNATQPDRKGFQSVTGLFYGSLGSVRNGTLYNNISSLLMGKLSSSLGNLSTLRVCIADHMWVACVFVCCCLLCCYMVLCCHMCAAMIYLLHYISTQHPCTRHTLQRTLHNTPSRMLCLQLLNLGGNLLSGTIPLALSGLPDLQQVVLSDNALRGELPPSLSDATSLALFDVANNVLNGSLPLQWCNSRCAIGANGCAPPSPPPSPG